MLPPSTYDPEFPLDSIQGDDIRSDLGGEESQRELGESLLQGQLQPIGINIRGKAARLIWGGRRVAAGKLVGMKTLKAMVYHDLSDRQERIEMGVENLQRLEMSEQDTYLFCASLEQDGMARKEIAEAIKKSPGTVTHYLSPDACPPSAKQAFLEGRLKLGHCYKISTSKDKFKTMDRFLKGATRAEVEAENRLNGDAPSSTVKANAIKLPLGDDFTFVVKGPALSLDAGILRATQAIKLMEAARADGHDAKSIKTWLTNKKPKNPKKKGGDNGQAD
jgi:ParB/RepB/Spo0J family partition protein